MTGQGDGAPDFELPDQDGRAVKVLRKVKPAEHDELVLETLKETVPPPA